MEEEPRKLSTPSASNSNNNNKNNRSCIEANKAILYTLSKNKDCNNKMSTTTTTATTNKNKRGKIRKVIKEIQHTAGTGFAWLFVFIPSVTYYIHRSIHFPHSFSYNNNNNNNKSSLLSSSSSLHLLWNKYSLITKHVAISSDINTKDMFFFASQQNNNNDNDNDTDSNKLLRNKELLYPLEQVLDFSNSSTRASLTGLLWVHDEDLGRGYLLFSDTGANRIWRWEVGGGPITIGRTLFMERSGCRSGATTCSTAALGSSCLATEIGSSSVQKKSGSLIVCELGEQRLVRIEQDGARTPLLTHLPSLQQPLKGPNAVVHTPFGDLLVADAYTGLWKLEEAYKVDPIPAIKSKEAHFQSANYTTGLQLLYGKLARPHGLAISKDLKNVFLSDSDANNPVIVKLPVDYEEDEDDDNDDDDDDDDKSLQDIGTSNGNGDGTKTRAKKGNGDDNEDMLCGTDSTSTTTCSAKHLKGILDELPANDVVFFNATSSMKMVAYCCGTSSSSWHAGIQGLAVDNDGNVWAAVTGLGGVVILSPDNGSILGCICTTTTDSNDDAPTDVAFGDDGYLYITTRAKLLRLKVKSKKLNVPNMAQKKK